MARMGRASAGFICLLGLLSATGYYGAGWPRPEVPEGSNALASAPSASTLSDGPRQTFDALPWDERMGLERAIAESDPRYEARIDDGVPLLETEGVRAHIASMARLTVGGHELTLRATSIGRGETREALREGHTEIADGSVQSERAPGVVEWWRSLPSGLEHGVTIAERPTGEGQLSLEIEIGGLGIGAVDPRGAELTADGEVVAQYAGLTVVDAAGASVPARMARAEHGVLIAIDDASAA